MSGEKVNEKRQIKKEVLARIKKGEPKQQILEELSLEYKDKITIVKQLENTPSIMMRHKYLKYNYLMSALLLTILVLDVIAIFRAQWHHPLVDTISYLNVAIDIILLTGAVLYRIENYSWIAARAIVSLIQIIITHVYYHQGIDLLTFIVLALIIISFLLGMFLGIKLCPPRIPKIIEVNVDDKETIKKTVYVFPD